MQPTYMRSVSFWGKFTSGSRIRANRSDLLKLPNSSNSSTTSTVYKCLRAKTTSGASPPKAFSMLFHQTSLSLQHFHLRSIKLRDLRELEAMEREYCNDYLVWSGKATSINSPSSRTSVLTTMAFKYSKP